MLFRPEVIDQGTTWIGGLRAARTTPTWLVTCVALLLAAGLMVYGVFGTYARKTRVAGILVSQGGEFKVTAPAAGYVSELKVHEGESVKAGQPLLVITTDRTTELRQGTGYASAHINEQIEKRRQAIRAQQHSRESTASLQKATQSLRMRSLDIEIEKIEDEINLQQRRRDIAATSLKRYEQLEARQFVSSFQVQQHQETLLDHEARLKALERNLAAVRKDRDASELELRQVNAQMVADLAAIQRDFASLNQEETENALRRVSVVTATRDGVVSALAVGLGQDVAAGQNLAALQPTASTLEAHIYAPTRTAGFVRVGQQVLVRYGAFPYQKFGVQYGRVTAVSQSAFAPNELSPALQTLFGRQEIPEALYRVTVSLSRQHIRAFDYEYPLRPGMALDADILQERRSIIEWLFEPLFAFSRRT